jgi:hypothetical protein
MCDQCQHLQSSPPKHYAPPTTCFALWHWQTYTPGQCTPTAPVASLCNPSATCNMCFWRTFSLNSILVRAVPSQNDGAMIAVFTDILANLNASRSAPTLNKMVNECSKVVEAHIQSNHMDIHPVPPHNHRVNAAECAIATFKEHFISALATVNRNHPLQLWDDFLPQAELTLNLLQFS